jgi:hypothetical protein
VNISEDNSPYAVGVAASTLHIVVNKAISSKNVEYVVLKDLINYTPDN